MSLNDRSRYVIVTGNKFTSTIPFGRSRVSKKRKRNEIKVNKRFQDETGGCAKITARAAEVAAKAAATAGTAA